MIEVGGRDFRSFSALSLSNSFHFSQAVSVYSGRLIPPPSIYLPPFFPGRLFLRPSFCVAVSTGASVGGGGGLEGVGLCRLLIPANEGHLTDEKRVTPHAEQPCAFRFCCSLAITPEVARTKRGAARSLLSSPIQMNCLPAQRLPAARPTVTSSLLDGARLGRSKFH